jgi:hypothetical protein
MSTEPGAAVAYAVLRAAAAAAEATLASARAEAAVAEAVAAAARSTVDVRVKDAQAAVAAMRMHPCHAFSGSPHFGLLDAHSSLRLVTDAAHEDDALCLALTCRALRDALWARFPRRPAGDSHAGARVRTRDAAVVGTVGRLAWARGRPRRGGPGARAWPESRAWWRGEAWQLDVICAANGALASLQWARANGCDWSARTCMMAAQGGYLEVLQWLRANGCDWDAKTCSRAAEGGHLEVLQWARANGCGWNVDTCNRAA